MLPPHAPHQEVEDEVVLEYLQGLNFLSLLHSFVPAFLSCDVRMFVGVEAGERSSSGSVERPKSVQVHRSVAVLTSVWLLHGNQTFI